MNCKDCGYMGRSSSEVLMWRRHKNQSSHQVEWNPRPLIRQLFPPPMVMIFSYDCLDLLVQDNQHILAPFFPRNSVWLGCMKRELTTESNIPTIMVSLRGKSWMLNCLWPHVNIIYACELRAETERKEGLLLAWQSWGSFLQLVLGLLPPGEIKALVSGLSWLMYNLVLCI